MIDFARYIIFMTCPCLSPGRLKVVGDIFAQTRVRRMPASSPTGLAESGSLSLRTGRSPHVAPHLFSRKRNYLVGFRLVTVAWKGLTPSCSNAFTGAGALVVCQH